MKDIGRLALITPNWRWDDAPLPVDTLLPPPAPPLEWAYLASQLPADCVEIIDAYGANLTPDQLAEAVSESKAKYAVISTAPSLLYWRCPPMTLGAVKCAVQFVREAIGSKIFIVGPHPTHSPAWSLVNSGADAVFRGAPERGLVPYLLSAKSEDCNCIEGGASGSAISVLSADELPIARFSSFDWSIRYEPHMWSVTSEEKRRLSLLGRSTLMESSRGCPWNCSYCAKVPVRDKFSRRSHEPLERELDDLKDLNIDYIFFIDETFNLGGQRLYALLDLLEAKRFRFGFQGRADLVTVEVAQRLAAAGCVYAELGIDVTSDELSIKIDRRQSVKRAEAGIAAAKDCIPVTRFNRINLSTRDYAIRLGLASEQKWDFPADPAYPYPGAPLGEMLMRLHGRSSFDWPFAQKYSWWLRLEVFLQRQHPDLPGATIDEFQKMFLNLSDEAAAAFAEMITFVVSDELFAVANKYFEGEGSGVRIHHSGT